LVEPNELQEQGKFAEVPQRCHLGHAAAIGRASGSSAGRVGRALQRQRHARPR
jgi:hypothetical protein